MQLKPIGDQVVVVLGASSGIGRESAKRLAARGARLVAAARNEAGLASLVDEIRARGGEAEYAVCDVVDFAQVEGVADLAVRRYGRIDTWVNCAAVLIFARFEETTLEEFRRVLEVNVMGQVHGARAALPHLRREGRGALISLSSVESVMSLPLHSAYSASKHAVAGFIDALRRELRAEGAPISVTSVRPATINTPIFTNALTRMGVKPRGGPPFYDPGVVAECVLYAAEHPVRDLWAGGTGRIWALGQWTMPRVIDAIVARFGIIAQRTNEPKPAEGSGNLYEPSGDQRVRGDFSGEALGFSILTWLETRPRKALLATAGLAAATAAVGMGVGLTRGSPRIRR